MGYIARLEAVINRELPGIRIFPFSGDLQSGEPQEILVEAAPNVEIPLHVHTVDAIMDIVGGSGEVLSDDPKMNSSKVGRGDRVFFEKNIAHGFHAGPSGLLFISRNGGIVDSSSTDKWDIEFTI